LEAEEVEYKLAGEFLAGLKKEFGKGDKEVVKVTELKKLEQGEREQWKNLYRSSKEQ